MIVDGAAFFRYTYILLWRYGQVVKTSASQAEIEGSIPSSATKYFEVLPQVSVKLEATPFLWQKMSRRVATFYLGIYLNKTNI